MNRLMGLLGATALAMLAAGCMFGSINQADITQLAKFTPEDVIKPGQTTRQEIIAALGPPLALARQGVKTTVFFGDTYLPMSSSRTPEVYFELFRDRLALRDNHVIYYYRSASSYASESFVIFAMSRTVKLHIKSLWVLVDDDTGIVQDYIFRTKGVRK